MVRLKGKYKVCDVSKLTLFQFLMVRLKVIEFTLFSSLKMKFQFLMVRLKVSHSTSALQENFISIPYGAIKSTKKEIDTISARAFQFLMVRLKVPPIKVFTGMNNISIPYGAIKRFIWHEFYFWLFDISIPYGAIKSQLDLTHNRRGCKFQFLMVRLKGGTFFLMNSALIHFNSLWCD